MIGLVESRPARPFANAREHDLSVASAPTTRVRRSPSLRCSLFIVNSAALIWNLSNLCATLTPVPMVPELERMLRGASLRITRPRVAVLGAVHEHPHADTHSIIGLVRGELGEVSQQAVYDVLNALTDAGLIRRIHPPGSVARYESRVGDNHHHVVCRSCGVIADVDCAVGIAPCLTATEDHGFVIDEAEVIYRGLCPACNS
jgi:Fur family transcriptional regulator, stress-responsive regulator